MDVKAGVGLHRLWELSQLLQNKKHRNHTESDWTRNNFMSFLLTSYILLIEQENYMIPG